MEAVAGERIDVGSQLENVRRRIALACERVGRDPGEVTLVGATKTVPPDRIREALDRGLAHLGENRLQEAVTKMKALSDRAPIWHFIGHLQANKARRAAELFDRIEAVDSLKLARVLESAVEEIGRQLCVFVQVKIGDESTKHGVPLAELPRFIGEVDALPSLTVSGLMAVPPLRDDPEDSRKDFRTLREARDLLAESYPDIRHLSMGMSGDFEIAIEEGATEVRIGTALFGAR